MGGRGCVFDHYSTRPRTGFLAGKLFSKRKLPLPLPCLSCPVCPVRGSGLRGIQKGPGKIFFFSCFLTRQPGFLGNFYLGGRRRVGLADVSWGGGVKKRREETENWGRFWGEGGGLGSALEGISWVWRDIGMENIFTFSLEIEVEP